jgi:hypothetical protein
MKREQFLNEQLNIVSTIINYIDNNRSKHFVGDFDSSIMSVLISMERDIKDKLSVYDFTKNINL